MSDDLITSAFLRAARLSGLVARVGMSVAAQQARDFVLADPVQQMRRLENQLKNAARVVEDAEPP